jgi:hypothetical protein
MILDQNRKLIEYTRHLYSGPEKPTLDNLVDTLATHALLDRKGRDQSQIGFINDFVFGTFVGQIISESSAEKIEKDISVYMIELAVTAYRVQNLKNKSTLWDKIQPIINKVQISTVFTFDIYLKGTLKRNYIEISIYDISIFKITFIDFKIESSIFINCSFKNCTFQTNNIYNTSFINCNFDGCTIFESGFLDDKNGITTIKCKQENCMVLVEDNTPYLVDKEDLITEKEVLERIWTISASKGHHIIRLIKYFGDQNKKKITKTLKSLEDKGYISLRGSFIQFEINKLHLVKEIIDTNNEISS